MVTNVVNYIQLAYHLHANGGDWTRDIGHILNTGGDMPV
jgi:hypothetical protein